MALLKIYILQINILKYIKYSYPELYFIIYVSLDNSMENKLNLMLMILKGLLQCRKYHTIYIKSSTYDFSAQTVH